MPSVLAITARRINRKATGRGQRPLTSYDGLLIGPPEVGMPLVIVRPDHSRMITSPVVRVLSHAGREMVYVETRNSVFRVSMRSAVM